MKFKAVFIVFVLCGLPVLSFAEEKAELIAEEKTELIDEDKDGRQETKMFYDEYGKVKAEVDLNADGQPDRFVKFKHGKRYSAENDKNFDGKIETWDYYGSNGALIRSAKDTNGDGKPDQFKHMVNGRDLILKEDDRNLDGRVDKRWLVQWGERKLGPGLPSIPGYITLWKEEDNDYDGKIDLYKEKGSKTPSRDRIGQSIDTPPPMGPKKAAPTPKGETPSEKRMREMNKRLGLQ